MSTKVVCSLVVTERIRVKAKSDTGRSDPEAMAGLKEAGEVWRMSVFLEVCVASN